MLANLGERYADVAMVGEDLDAANVAGAGVADRKEATEAGGMEGAVQLFRMPNIAAIDFEDEVAPFEACPGGGRAVGHGGDADTFVMESLMLDRFTLDQLTLTLTLNCFSAVRWIVGLGRSGEGKEYGSAQGER